MRWSGLRGKMLLLFMLLPLPLVAMLISSAVNQRREMDMDVREETIRTARLMARNRLEVLEQVRVILVAISESQGVRGDDADCKPLMQRMLALNPVFANIGATDEKGNITCSAIDLPPEARSLANNEAFRMAMKTGRFSHGLYEEGGVGQTKSVIFVSPFFDDDGQAIGVTFIAIDLLVASLFRSSELQLPTPGTISLFGEEGRYLLHYPDPEEWVGREASPKVQRVLNSMASDQKELVFSKRTDGRTVFVVYEKINFLGGAPFFLRVEVERPAAYARVLRALVEQLAIAAGVTLLAIVGAWWMGNRYIVQPTQRLRQVILRTRTGDLSQRSQLGPEMGEFHEIGLAFDATADALAQRIAELNRTQDELREARDQLELRVQQRTAELQKAQERLVDAIESLDSGFAMFDAEDRLFVFNRAYKRMYGPDAERMVRPGIGFEELFRHFIEAGVKINGKPADEAWLQERMRDLKAADGRAVLVRQDDRWLQISITRMRDGGSVSLRTDVTPLKEAEESLLLRDRAIASLKSGVVVSAIDPVVRKEEIVDINPAFERITGYRKSEVMGKDVYFFKGPGSNDKDFDDLLAAMFEGREYNGVLRSYRKDGTPFFCEVRLAPVFDEQRVLRYCVGIMDDVTLREEARAESERIAQELRRSNEELEQFAYVVSHDLQEPLRMVSSYTELLARRYADKLDQDGKDFIAFASDGAKRMQAFIRDLLKYSRVNTQGGRFEPVPLNPLVVEVLDNYRFAVAEVQADVVVHPLPTVRGDRTQLLQLFQNLIGNALKFRDEARPLKVEVKAVEEEHGMVTIAVQDNGIGLDEADAEKIFIIFARLHSREKYEGTGIGLAICKRIVERHGGQIWVNSRPGEGSTFYFTLPLVPAEEGKKTDGKTGPVANL